MTRDEFRALATQGLIMDGATGSNLIAVGMPQNVHAEDWLQEHPEEIIKLQRAYAAAGSNMVLAPTFTASGAYHKEGISDLNQKMVALSREAVPGLLVSGDMTTVARYDMAEEDMRRIYSEQAAALLEAGVDCIDIETMMGLPETICALEEVRKLSDSIAVLCTFSITPKATLYFGGTLYTAVKALEERGADAVGVNCSCGPEDLANVIEKLKETVALPIIAKPNAGNPERDALGRVSYRMTPAEFAEKMLKLKTAGASILGGCCGTTPAHIQALREALEQAQ